MTCYVEFCSGIGGTRAGLDAAGWECLMAVDNDPDAVEIHNLAHGPALLGDISAMSAESIPEASVWVAGFPCQPFSSSGSRLGFSHSSGHVFLSLENLIAQRLPPVVFLENVVGLLSNKAGHTFAMVLRRLTNLGYRVDWMVIDLRSFHVPQSRPRLFILGSRRGILQARELPSEQKSIPGFGAETSSFFANFLQSARAAWVFHNSGSLDETITRTEPAIGKPEPRGPKPFSSLGWASGDAFETYRLEVPTVTPSEDELAQVVAPHFSHPELIRSARYWSPKGGGGERGLHIRDEALSHCVGTSLGGAPLFSVPASAVGESRERDAFLQYADWSRFQDGLVVMRLRPDRAVRLFGPYTDELEKVVGAWDGPSSKKFQLVGNMVAPVCSYSIALEIDQQLLRTLDTSAAGLAYERRRS